MSKYVCLEGLKHGNRFFTSCDKESDENSKLRDGTVAYKILGYANTSEKAQEILYGPDLDTYEKRKELFRNYMKNLTEKMPELFAEESVNRMADTLAFMDSREEKEGAHIYYTLPNINGYNDLLMGWDWLSEKRPEIIESIKSGDLSKTHSFIGVVHVTDLEKIFDMFQGEAWSPNGEAREIIERASVRHTSMSVGDIVKIKGKMYFCDSCGWKEIPCAE